MDEKIRLDIGCGAKKRKGYIGLDFVDHTVLYPKGEFVTADIDKVGIPFPENSVTRIFSHESMEHFKRFEFVMDEVVRVCKNNAIVEIIVPHNVSDGAFYEKHYTFFRVKSFQGEYELESLPYKVEKVKILFWKKPGWLFFPNYLWEFLFNLHPRVLDFYHKTGLKFLFPAWSFYYKLRIKK
jgi:SAM-dependent methyltransferase